MSEQPGLKLPMPDQGAKVLGENRMIHPFGPVSEDKSASATRTKTPGNPDTSNTPSTPIIYGVRSPS